MLRTPTHPNKGFKPLVPTIDLPPAIEQRQLDRLDRFNAIGWIGSISYIRHRNL